MKKTLIYGNGLSLYLASYIRERFNNPYIKYLDSTSFLLDFLKAKAHERIYRQFIKYFEITDSTFLSHEYTKKILLENIDDIKLLGFERWFSKNLFNKNINMRLIKVYLYFFYNYWYVYIIDEIFSNIAVENIVSSFSDQIINNLQSDYSTYTINFDSFLDGYLFPEHLHGRFCDKLNKYQDVIAFKVTLNDFEYKYLFGTNGYEKFYRINEIKTRDHPSYDLDFFFNDNVFYGDVFIYGIALGRAEVFSDPFFDKYPEHQGNHLFTSVDGHLIVRLESLFLLNQLNSLTIAYYSDHDLKNYKYFLSKSKISKFIQYKKSTDVLTII